MVKSGLDLDTVMVNKLESGSLIVCLKCTVALPHYPAKLCSNQQFNRLQGEYVNQCNQGGWDHKSCLKLDIFNSHEDSVQRDSPAETK